MIYRKLLGDKLGGYFFGLPRRVLCQPDYLDCSRVQTDLGKAMITVWLVWLAPIIIMCRIIVIAPGVLFVRIRDVESPRERNVGLFLRTHHSFSLSLWLHHLLGLGTFMVRIRMSGGQPD
ncbi:hypothetical protein L211DRAFT_125547 [Terfezia boudieri ATCC MYA-4762]|uniref:Uncharacterized protein n=1 Tax=Terfezia boudieri ATCC MYA-4762 TaxID=1051890 RepID=A0A3N4L5S7_9PEZI|nr:hypothetical protein L211DRAFT_125547 [Terfezia boudieri ATCC MYA-4762]